MHTTPPVENRQHSVLTYEEDPQGTATKEITYAEECCQATLRGVNKVTNVVEVTLGPRGRTVVIDKEFGSPLSTKDAVMVAK